MRDHIVLNSDFRSLSTSPDLFRLFQYDIGVPMRHSRKVGMATMVSERLKMSLSPIHWSLRCKVAQFGYFCKREMQATTMICYFHNYNSIAILFSMNTCFHRDLRIGRKQTTEIHSRLSGSTVRAFSGQISLLVSCLTRFLFFFESKPNFVRCLQCHRFVRIEISHHYRHSLRLP